MILGSIRKFPSLSLAERMANVTGTAVTSESVAAYSRTDPRDDELSDELQNIFKSFQQCLELRKKYMLVSLQCPGDNPKDQDDWNIYPPPPKPSYPPVDNANEAESIAEFEFEKCHIPGKSQHVYKMGSDGTYRVYENGSDDLSTIELMKFKINSFCLQTYHFFPFHL
jgi:AMP deaminase